jgi:hypothetical protein
MLSFLGLLLLAAVAFGAWSLRAGLSGLDHSHEARPSRAEDTAAPATLPQAGAALAESVAADTLDPEEAWFEDVFEVFDDPVDPDDYKCFEPDLNDDADDFGFNAGFGKQLGYDRYDEEPFEVYCDDEYDDA